MMTLEECRKILYSNNENKHYNDDEIKQIRDFLYQMAKLEIEYNNIKNSKNYECNTILQSKFG